MRVHLSPRDFNAVIFACGIICSVLCESALLLAQHVVLTKSFGCKSFIGFAIFQLLKKKKKERWHKVDKTATLIMSPFVVKGGFFKKSKYQLKEEKHPHWPIKY